ncbi:manganese efflux pump MntP family protein [Psychroflexus sp. CAK57W]|uniref:manganese efflux pump MntP n=1 Tax=Psychroflexus curvus TaxID=2873595 RepID=UPI001CC9ABC3|nr:manganese efflux pump [Psychroflexus curvus]MBZ9627659.1 manganese efflux pump MntP family protein [Psychroflexus curvus]MBZ9786146.1 manganese efflux pump MntP family protein [Psychroflexus curvus]
MDTINLILLGIVIASNNLSFAFGLGALDISKYHLRIVLIFTLVEFTIPLVGLFMGQYVSLFIENYADFIGSLILVGLGVYVIFSFSKTKKEIENTLEYIISIKGLILIALGLSLDNLLVGFSLGLGEVNPLKLAGFIGFFSGLFSFIGLKTGKFIKNKSGNYIQVFAGIVLILLGVINYFGMPL